MHGAGEDLSHRAVLHDAACVHDGDLVGQVGNHCKIVGDVQRRDTVQLRKRADRCKYMCLRRYVEAGGRLVEHNDRRTAGKCHGQTDALLLAARELMRVATQEVCIGREQYLFHHLGDARRASRIGYAEPVHIEYLAQLLADGERRVERRCRVLRHVGNRATTDGPQRLGTQRHHRSVGARHVARSDADAPARVSEHCEANRGLPRPGLADQPENAAGCDVQVDLVDDVVAGHLDL